MARSKKILTVPALHVIAQAVEPLRLAAVAQATEKTNAFLADIKAQIVAQPLINTLAPYPKYVDQYRAPKSEYLAYSKAYDFRTLVSSLTVEIEDADSRDSWGCRDADKVRVAWDDAAAATYLRQAVEQAEHNFVVYALKLIGKVEADDAKAATATLEGDRALWTESTLTVTLTDGTVQRWYTKMIWNVSVLGNVFNQYPTRLLKK